MELAVVRVDATCGWGRLDALGIGHHVGAVVRGPVPVHESADREPMARQRDRRLDGLLPRDGPKTSQRLVKAGDSPRNANGLVADIVDPAVEHVAVTIRSLAD